MFIQKLQKKIWGAATAQWIRLCLPYCCPRFESQVHHLHFYQFKFKLWHVEKTKINRKRGRDWPIFLKNYKLGIWQDLDRLTLDFGWNLCEQSSFEAAAVRGWAWRCCGCSGAWSRVDIEPVHEQILVEMLPPWAVVVVLAVVKVFGDQRGYTPSTYHHDLSPSGEHFKQSMWLEKTNGNGKWV